MNGDGEKNVLIKALKVMISVMELFLALIVLFIFGIVVAFIIFMLR